MSAAGPDKKALLDALLARLRADLAAVESSQRDTQAGAVHEEARPESDKDTRATEASYLARGLARRVEELGASLSQLSNLALRSFGDDDTVALGAVVAAEREDASGEVREVSYFMVPSAGGIKLEHGGTTVHTLTPGSPLGQALVGKRVDDELEAGPAKARFTLTITAIR